MSQQLGTHHHRRYDLTCDEYTRRVEQVEDRCEICRTRGPESSHGRLFIDHDADRGLWFVRGLLCGTCNTMLGLPRYGAVGRSLAYLTRTPWIADLCMAAGRPTEMPEPRSGTWVKGGRPPHIDLYRRDGELWSGPRGSAKTWQQLHRRYGPRRLAVTPA
ncbi:endonuclease domain-containing protein [Micromonospora sp. L32]|uniref:endonuclease domain-containing protein n=1 Tax=Micromonospora sp. L32 TaxID=3452214 RepID=UPI003F889A16